MIPLIDALAVARLTRLVTVDTFPPAARLRARTLCSPRTPPAVAELLECPWCVSFWAALTVVALRRWAPTVWAPLGATLAYSEVAGLLAEAR